MLDNKEYVENRYQFEYIMPLVLIMLPFMGKEWFHIMMQEIDPYTPLIIICLVIALCNFIVYKYNNIHIHINVSTLVFLLVAVFSLSLSLIINNNFTLEHLYLMACWACIYLCSMSKINNNTLYILGVASFILLIINLGYSTQYNYDEMVSRYFNPNVYGVNLYVLCGLSLFATLKMKSEIRKCIYAIAVTLPTFFACYVIYECVTGSFVLLVLLACFLARRLFKNKKFSVIFLFLIMALMIIVPMTVAALIENGNTDLVKFLHYRGGQWILTLEQLRLMGFMGVAPVFVDAHNAFYDMCINYSIFTGLAIFIAIMGVGIVYCIKGKNSEVKFISISIVIMYLLACLVEAFYRKTFTMSFIICLLLMSTRVLDNNEIDTNTKHKIISWN